MSATDDTCLSPILDVYDYLPEDYAKEEAALLLALLSNIGCVVCRENGADIRDIVVQEFVDFAVNLLEKRGYHFLKVECSSHETDIHTLIREITLPTGGTVDINYGNDVNLDNLVYIMDSKDSIQPRDRDVVRYLNIFIKSNKKYY